MSDTDDVREASKNFYSALSRMCTGEVGALAGAWAHDASVTALHPIGGREVGWEAVGNSFDQVAQVCTGGAVRIEDQLIQVGGDLAYEVGMERGRATMAGKDIPIDHRVTNIYRRNAGKWVMVHHHTDLSQAMLDMLAGLKA